MLYCHFVSRITQENFHSLTNSYGFQYTVKTFLYISSHPPLHQLPSILYISSHPSFTSAPIHSLPLYCFVLRLHYEAPTANLPPQGRTIIMYIKIKQFMFCPVFAYYKQYSLLRLTKKLVKKLNRTAMYLNNDACVKSKLMSQQQIQNVTLYIFVKNKTVLLRLSKILDFFFTSDIIDLCN